ncbi:hypothetical protein Tco_0936349 [Tanacetum coccineum]
MQTQQRLFGVKLLNVPIVAYSETWLSLITTKFKRPIMLDAYTSNLCLKSWGRDKYARALIKVSSKHVLVELLVVAITFQNGSGHTMETIDVEYEVSDDGFVEVTRKHGNGKQTAKTRHIDGVRLTKPKPNYYYRPISKSAIVNGEASTLQPKENKDPSTPQSNNKDNGKPMDDLVDGARKKVKTPRKTGIWSGRKANSPKRSVAFSLEMNVHYFDRDDMIFDDIGQTTEEVEHENVDGVRNKENNLLYVLL